MRIITVDNCGRNLDEGQYHIEIILVVSIRLTDLSIAAKIIYVVSN